MGNYLGDYTQNYARGQQDLAQGLQQYDLTGMQQQADYRTQLSSLETQKQRDIANAALGISMLRPYFGSS